MKKLISILLILFAVNFLLSSSCKKNNDPPAAKTKTELLSQGTWKFKSAVVGTTDYSNNLQTCQKDNILTFLAAGTGNVDEGPTKCNAADPQTNPFTWNFQTNETKLFISTLLFTGGSNTFDLISLTETELVVATNFSFGPGPVFYVILTFNH